MPKQNMLKYTYTHIDRNTHIHTLTHMHTNTNSSTLTQNMLMHNTHKQILLNEIN